MKNIWKLLMVAVMAIAMVGCPQPNNNNNEENNNNGNGSSDGVYSISGDKTQLKTSWGGNESRAVFSVVFLDDTVKEAIADGTITDLNKLPAGMAIYQIQGYGNAAFKTGTNGNFNVYGVENGENYSGLAVTISGDNFTLYADLSKLVKTQLKGIGADYGASGRVLTDADSFDISEVAPCVIALSTDTSSDAHIGTVWSAPVHAMAKTNTAFPSNLQDFPNVKPAKITDINVVRGSVIGSSWEQDTANMTNGVYSVDVTADGTVFEWKFTVAGYGWDFQVGGITDAALQVGTKTELISKEQNDGSDPKNLKVTLNKGTHTIKYEVEGTGADATAYVTVQ